MESTFHIPNGQLRMLFEENETKGLLYGKFVRSIVPDRINLWVYPFDEEDPRLPKPMLFSVILADDSLFNRMKPAELENWLMENKSFDTKFYIDHNQYVEFGVKVYIGDEYVCTDDK